jgi:DNA-binding transcriptional ArsR family regulator
MSTRASAARADPATAAPLFAALGDETRLRIVGRLCAEGPLTIVSLSAGAPVTRQAITKHLHALAAAGLVRGVKKSGQRQQTWVLSPRRLEEAQAYLDHISQQWDDALDRLKSLVEE